MGYFWQLLLFALFSIFSLNLRIKHQNILETPLHSPFKDYTQTNAHTTPFHSFASEHQTSSIKLQHKSMPHFTIVTKNARKLP